MKAADMVRLKGGVALVTGASSGRGRHFARTLADNGAAVAPVARRVERLAELQASIEAAGGCAITVEASVTNRRRQSARLTVLRAPISVTTPMRAET